MRIQNPEKYSRGWRGAPAKGVGRLRGARVQIPLSPFVICKIKTSKKVEKSTWQKDIDMINFRSSLERDERRRELKNFKKVKKVLDKALKQW